MEKPLEEDYTKKYYKDKLTVNESTLSKLKLASEGIDQCRCGCGGQIVDEHQKAILKTKFNRFNRLVADGQPVVFQRWNDTLMLEVVVKKGDECKSLPDKVLSLYFKG